MAARIFFILCLFCVKLICGAKIVQGESKNASLLAFFAEPQPIFVIFEAKIVQGESKNASLLAFFAEPQPIFVIFVKQR